MHSVIEFLLLPSLSLVHSSSILLFFARRGHWALSPAPSGRCRLPPAPTGCCHQRPPGAVTSAQRLLSTSASARRLLSTSASAQKPRLPFTQRVNGLRHTLPTYLEGEAHSWSNEEREGELEHSKLGGRSSEVEPT